MFSETAELYDLIYRTFKDYEAETREVAALLKRVHPEAATVLDVGCGTGEHARILRADTGYDIDGLDIEPAFVEIAARKNPGGRFVRADMTGFALERRYDVIMCLFSSIGYARTLDNVRRAFECFRAHLAPGGVVVVEAWFEPDGWRPGTVYLNTVEAEGVTIARMSHSVVRDRVSILDFHYLIGRATGVEHRHEIHELGLFTADEMARAFGDAGLEVTEYDPAGLTERGLYVARAAP